MSLGKWVASYELLSIRPVASALLKSHVLNTTQTIFLLEKIWWKKRPEKRQVIVFKQSAIVSIVLSFVFGNLRGQQGFFAGVHGWVKVVSEGVDCEHQVFYLSFILPVTKTGIILSTFL